MPPPDFRSVLCNHPQPSAESGPREGANDHDSCVRRVDLVNSAINVVAMVATLLLLCIGVSGDSVAMASPTSSTSPGGLHSRAARTPLASSGDSLYNGRFGVGPSYSSLGSGGGHGRCRITVCWDAYHSAVDSSLVGLSLDELFNAESGYADNDDGEQSASSRSYDRLTMTSAYCSRSRAPSAAATSPGRQQKRQGKAAHRSHDFPAEGRKRGATESASAAGNNSMASERRLVQPDAPSSSVGRRGGQTASTRRRDAAPSAGSDTGRRRLCVALRSLIECIERSADGCRGMLSYHSSRRLARSNLDRCNCSADTGNEFDGSGAESASTTDDDRQVSDGLKVRDPADLMLNDPATVGTISDSCRYRNRDVDGVGPPTVYDVCAVYGDPHVRTFDGLFQTCRVMGTWPLIDNEYLTVQVTNIRMGRNGGTVISKVSVIVKPYSDCSAPPGRYLTYLAEDGRLPSDWDPDSTFLDAQSVYSESDNDRENVSGLLIDEVDPGEHVEIYLAYIDTTVSLKLVGRYYSVTISAPTEVIRPEVSETTRVPHAVPSSNTTNIKQDNVRDEDHSSNVRYSLRPPSGGSSGRGIKKQDTSSLDVQLCVRGCPHREIVDLSVFFRRERQRIGRALSHDTKRTSLASGSTSDRLPIAGVPSPAASSSSSSASMPLMSLDDALGICRSENHLSGYLIDSCVFDLLNTGDLPFSQTAARGALVDLRRFIRTAPSSTLVGDSCLVDHSRRAPDRLPVTSSATVSPQRARLRYKQVVFFVTNYFITALTICILASRGLTFLSVFFVGEFVMNVDRDR